MFFIVVGALVAMGSVTAEAQTTAVAAPPFPARIQTSNVVTIGGAFSFSPTTIALTQNSQTGNLCSPGACYVGTISARANSSWKLQVKLASNPGAFSVYYVQTTVPASAQAVNSGVATLLSTSTWLTVATGTGATASTSIGIMFNARKGSGNSGVQPTSAQLSPVIAYQVVSNP